MREIERERLRGREGGREREIGVLCGQTLNGQLCNI